MPAILSRFSNLFINYISRDLDNAKTLLYMLFIRYMCKRVIRQGPMIYYSIWEFWNVPEQWRI